MVRWGQLANSSPPPPLRRALEAYRQLEFDGKIPDRGIRGSTGRNLRLNTGQVAELIKRYEAGDTVYQLAAHFDIRRATVSSILKKAGIQLRLRPPTPLVIADMVRLYESGLSLAAVSQCLHFDPTTVLRYLRLEGVVTRDCQGRERPC